MRRTGTSLGGNVIELYAEKLRTPLSIVFADVATHNHFVLDRGGKVFNRTAPVIKLPPGATEDDHLALLGLLNSSTACFWMKQVFHNKGSERSIGMADRSERSLGELYAVQRNEARIDSRSRRSTNRPRPTARRPRSNASKPRS